ncbi:hypothetical protein ANCDUO_00787 [Ancylostoma duodenale]|uniref:G-protein coupled receptors family 1 profile domain-containing protein n=1 Tax=Ancylostoma duodenale TaxID=51022 RepID=A0A0C2H4Z0_9BILA|nr:hypothetical protein ANCDUO_00787 [Ancylostoma duodenale]
MAAGPVSLLVVINSAIVVSMKRNKREEQNESDILTLVLVVCLFISCNVLPLTVNFLELVFMIVNAYLIDLSNLMVVKLRRLESFPFGINGFAAICPRSGADVYR